MGGSRVPFIHFPPVVISFKTLGQYNNQDIDIIFKMFFFSLEIKGHKIRDFVSFDTKFPTSRTVPKV